MVLYGIASAVGGDAEDFRTSREEAEAVLASIIRDEPDLEALLWVEPLELELSEN